MAHISTVFVLLAALCWGLSGGIGGILMGDGWDAYIVSFYRGVIGLVFVLVWLVLRPSGNGLNNPRLWFWSVIAGFGVAGNFAFYFVSIAEGGVAIAAPLMYCAPVFVYLVSFALKLEKPTLLKGFGIAVIMLGVVLLTGSYKAGVGGVTMLGVGAGLLSGLSYAVFIFGFKYAAPLGSPQSILVVAFMVLVAILYWPGDSEQAIAILNAPSWRLLVVLGVLGAGLSFILYIVGLHHTAPATASILAMVEPVTAALFGVVVLDESLEGFQILGMALILVTVTALSAYSNEKEPVGDLPTV